MRRPVLAPALALALALATAAGAQEVRTTVVPDTVTAGGIVRVAIRVVVERGAEVTFPDSLVLPADAEAAASRVIARDSVDGERDAVTATFALTAWRPGRFPLEPVEIRTQTGANAATVRVGLPPLTVVSVLPADTSGIQPQPPRGVIGPDRALLPLLLLAALLGLAAAGVVYALRKRKRRPVSIPATPPRERALAELDRIRRSGLLENGQYKAFCAAVSGVVRTYLAEIEPAWGTDLTTSELAGALRAPRIAPPSGIAEAARVEADRGDDAADPASALIGLLGVADVVKFTGVAGSASGADTIWTRARTWVGAWDASIRKAA
jgi:hypothetical protein